MSTLLIALNGARAIAATTSSAPTRALTLAGTGVPLAGSGTPTAGVVAGKQMVVVGGEVFQLHADGSLERFPGITSGVVAVTPTSAGISALVEGDPNEILPAKVTASGALAVTGGSVTISRLQLAEASPDGRLWAVVVQSFRPDITTFWTYRVTDSGSLEQVATSVQLPGDHSIHDLAFSPDGRYLAAIDRYPAAQVLTFAVSSTGVLTPSDAVFAGDLAGDFLAFNAGGFLLASATGRDSEITVFRLAGGLPTIVSTPTSLPKPSDGYSYRLAFSPDGTILSALGDQAQLFLTSDDGALTWVGYVDDEGRGAPSVAFSPDGRYLVVAERARDSSVNSVLSAYALTSPTLDTTITADPAAITETSSASFALDANYPASLECRLDAEPFHACDTTVAYTGLAEGHHRFQARARDLLGGVETTPATKTWDIDRSPPNVPDLIAPADAATGVVSGTSLTWAPTDDNVTGVDRYELSIDGVVVQTLSADACASVCGGAPDTPLRDGAHEWRVRAVDRAGHAADSVVRRFEVDAAAPDPFSTTGPTDGAAIAMRRPRLTWQRPVDAGSGASRYDVTIDGSQANTRPLTTTGWTPDGDLAEGAHRWSVTAYDVNGNARTSGSATFIVDTVAPTAALASSAVTAPPEQAITFDASASRDEGAGSIVRYEWDLDGDGTLETVTGTPAASHAYSTTVPVTVPVKVRVTDAVGLTATATRSVRIVPASTSKAAASVTIDGTAAYTNTPNVILRVAAPAFATRLEISNDASFSSAPSSAIAGKLPWKLDLADASKTPRRVHVRFTRGLIASDDFIAEIILDQDAPAVSSARRVRSGKRRVLALTAHDRGLAGVAAFQVTTNRSDVTKGFMKVKLRNGKARIGLSGLIARKTAYVRVRDNAGNVSAWVRMRS